MHKDVGHSARQKCENTAEDILLVVCVSRPPSDHSSSPAAGRLTVTNCNPVRGKCVFEVRNLNAVLLLLPLSINILNFNKFVLEDYKASFPKGLTRRSGPHKWSGQEIYTIHSCMNGWDIHMLVIDAQYSQISQAGLSLFLPCSMSGPFKIAQSTLTHPSVGHMKNKT